MLQYDKSKQLYIETASQSLRISATVNKRLSRELYDPSEVVMTMHLFCKAVFWAFI